MYEQRDPGETKTEKGSIQHQMWITWKKYRNTVQAATDQVRKAKAQIELNLAKDNKGDKGFCKYGSNKRKSRENVGPLLKKIEALVTQDSEKAKVLNTFLASVFTTKSGFQESQVAETRRKSWSEEDVPLVEEDWVREYLSKLDVPWALMECTHE